MAAMAASGTAQVAPQIMTTLHAFNACAWLGVSCLSDVQASCYVSHPPTICHRSPALPHSLTPAAFLLKHSKRPQMHSHTVQALSPPGM